MASDLKAPPLRRSDDAPDTDHRENRRRYPDMRRTLGSLALILVPILFAGVLWFAATDRAGVIQGTHEAQKTANEAKDLARVAMQQQAVASAESAAQWSEVLRRLGSIETDVKDIKRRAQ